MTRAAAALALIVCGALGSAALPAARADGDPVEDAAAATSDRMCTFAVGGKDEELRDDCSGRLAAWWDEILDPAKPAPTGWDESKLGPWSLVARTSGGGFVEERPGLVHVFVHVAAEGLPSRSDAADALIRTIVAAFEARVKTRADAVSAPPYLRAREDLDVASADLEKATRKVREVEAPHGGPPARRAETLATLLSDAERDASRTRIDRAVTAKKLDAARAAAERAGDLSRLQRAAEELQRRIEASKGDASGTGDLPAKLATLQARIDTLAKTSPPLDAAREEVFRLEVDLVGLEARSAVLVEELKSLRDEGSQVQNDVKRHAEFLRERSVAQAAVDDATSRIRTLVVRAGSRGPVFEVIRAPGPPSKAKQEEKR